MKTPGEQREKRDVFDVGPNVKKTPSRRHFFKYPFYVYGRNVLNLKPKFRIRHPWAWAVGFVAIIVVSFLGIRQLSTKADVHDFSPTTCLGNWQDVANAEGRPQTMGDPNPSFSAANSATYTTGTEIYCGGFLPPSFATSGQITNVGLTLVWQIGDASTSSVATSASTTPAVSTGASAPATSSDDSISSGTNSTSSDDGATVAGSSTPTSSSISSTASSSASDATVDELSTDTSSPVSASVPDTSSSSASNTDAAQASTPDVVSSPDPASVSTPAPTPAPTADSSSTSFIRQLIPFAFADDVSSGTVSIADTTTAETASDTAATSTSISAPAPIPDENFLDVSYSTDGQTWVSVGEVNMSNWQQFTVTLPIADWADLQNLQIRVEGIPTTQDPIPPVYLDGMFVEVHYDAALSINPSVDMASSTDEATSSATPSSSRMTLVDPGAQQACDIQPFSQVLPLGGTAVFTVNLHPSINGVSYDLLLGHLPLGVSAGFGSPSGSVAATSSLTFQAQTTIMPGSMNIVVIYQEHEEDGTVLSNFCQLNIDVK